MPKQYSFSPKTTKKTKVGENTTGSNTSLGSGSVGGQVTWSLSESDLKQELETPIFLPSCRRDKGLEDDLKCLDPIKHPSLVLETLCSLILLKDYGTLDNIQKRSLAITNIAREIKEKINGEQETKRNQSI